MRPSAPSPPAADDELWSAIGDPTRRRMPDALPITRQAVAKHLAVLDRVGLVRATPVGREWRYQVDEAQLARAAAQLASTGAAWDARLQRIKRIAETIQRAQEAAGDPARDKPEQDQQNQDQQNQDQQVRVQQVRDQLG